MIVTKAGYIYFNSKGASFELKRNNGMTAFILAHKYRHSEILNLLKQNGASEVFGSVTAPDFD